MSDRRGEKRGWTVGMLGGTAWMFILAACALFAGDWQVGVLALALGSCVVGLVIHLAPWKHPSTPFWKLFLPPIAVMIMAACVMVVLTGQGLPLSQWIPGLAVCVWPALIPGIGSRRWPDGNAGQKAFPAETEIL